MIRFDCYGIYSLDASAHQVVSGGDVTLGLSYDFGIFSYEPTWSEPAPGPDVSMRIVVSEPWGPPAIYTTVEGVGTTRTNALCGPGTPGVNPVCASNVRC